MAFAQRVQALRDQYLSLRDKHNFFGASACEIEDVSTERVDGREIESFWLSTGKYIRLVNTPDSLSGDILRLKENLPNTEGSFEVDGNQIRKIDIPPPLPQREDDSEDITDELEALPIIDVDEELHHVKRGKYKSEIQTLLRCQGGRCPGQRISPHVVHLLGKTEDGYLVFEKLSPRYLVLNRFCSIAVYKRWVLHLVEALKALHSIGIVHRDLHLENLLFTPDGQTLVVGDLECRWGQRGAPEIACDDGINSGWTEESDIYDVGVCIQALIYANIPATSQVDWPVPAPFDRIVAACKSANPNERPSLEEISAMLDAIDDSQDA